MKFSQELQLKDNHGTRQEARVKTGNGISIGFSTQNKEIVHTINYLKNAGKSSSCLLCSAKVCVFSALWVWIPEWQTQLAGHFLLTHVWASNVVQFYKKKGIESIDMELTIRYRMCSSIKKEGYRVDGHGIDHKIWKCSISK